MTKDKFLKAANLAALAEKFRKQAGKTRAQAARDMKVSQTSIFHAEETPAETLDKLRSRMIEAYSQFEVVGPVYVLTKKRTAQKSSKL